MEFTLRFRSVAQEKIICTTLEQFNELIYHLPRQSKYFNCTLPNVEITPIILTYMADRLPVDARQKMGSTPSLEVIVSLYIRHVLLITNLGYEVEVVVNKGLSKTDPAGAY